MIIYQALKYDFGAGTATTYEIKGLVNGKTYNVSVSASNTEGFESFLSVLKQAVPIGNSPGGSPDLAVDYSNSSANSILKTLEFQHIMARLQTLISFILRCFPRLMLTNI